MKVNIICDGWKINGTALTVEDNPDWGQFHSGTVFQAEIQLDGDEEKELERHLMRGHILKVYLLPYVEPAGKEKT